MLCLERKPQRVRRQSLAGVLRLRAVSGAVFVAIFGAIFICAAASPSSAGTLQFHESTVSPGQVDVIPAPATNAPIDLRVRPQSAEGGGFYGFSELTIRATGDLIIESSGFDCPAMNCLYSPLPFTSGTLLRATGADDLGGEFSNNQTVLTFSVSGTTGYLVIAGGEYIDATGAGGDPGDVQTITTAPLARVPEPSLLNLLAPGCLMLAGAAARRASN